MNLAALNLCIDRQDWSAVAKNVAKRKFRKWIERGEFHRLKPLFLYRYCCARMHLGDYSDYTGWEWRNEDGWAAKMLFEPQPLPRWDGGYVERLWIIGEQGVGDEVLYASLIPECLMRVKEVVYECDERLHKIIERSFPRTRCVPRPDSEVSGSDAWRPRSGVFLPAADLLRIFRRHRSHFPGKPYLKVDRDRAESFRHYDGRTGLAWRGRQGSIDPFSLGITDPLSLQYGEQVKGAAGAIESPDLDLKNDLEGLFALCSVLKKVVTVPQSVMHFAGSIGTKVEVIHWEEVGEEFRGTSGNVIPWDYSVIMRKMPFYPDIEVFTLKDWKLNNVVQRMIKSVEQKSVEGYTRP